MTVVFDTAFHQTMDETSYIYPVPYEWYKKYGIRKYGAHGTSHRYIAQTISELYGKENLNIISCHIGNGASLAAIKNGKCIDTSMGFTPLAGVMMGTRSGDIDPSILPPVMEKEGKDINQIMDDLNKHSGVLGVSGISSDMRDIEDGVKAGNEDAIRAYKKYVRRIVEYIAQYYVLLGGADVIVFTAGVGENCDILREDVCDYLACLGVKLDLEENKKRGDINKISSDDSKVDVYVVPTDEELMIARDTLKLIEG